MIKNGRWLIANLAKDQAGGLIHEGDTPYDGNFAKP
jgi:hypothetical protein